MTGALEYAQLISVFMMIRVQLSVCGAGNAFIVKKYQLKFDRYRWEKVHRVHIIKPNEYDEINKMLKERFDSRIVALVVKEGIDRLGRVIFRKIECLRYYNVDDATIEELKKFGEYVPKPEEEG